MKTKTLAVLSTTMFLSMSVVAHGEECNKEFWFQYPNGDTCVPYSFGIVHGGTTNLYKGAAYLVGPVGAAACVLWHRPARFCGLAKKLKGVD